MRQYPRRVYKTKEESLRVTDEFEERQASDEGFESHWAESVIKAREGTDRAILRNSPAEIVEIEIKEETPIAASLPVEEELSPQQRAAITRKKNKKGK